MNKNFLEKAALIMIGIGIGKILLAIYISIWRKRNEKQEKQ